VQRVRFAPSANVGLHDKTLSVCVCLGKEVKIRSNQAIANAIYDAVGVRLRDVPMTPERVLAALKSAR